MSLPPTPVCPRGAPHRVDAAIPYTADDLGRWHAQITSSPVVGARHLIDGVAMCEVTFTALEADPEVEVMVHLNGLTDAHRDDIEPALLTATPGSGVRHLTYLLPADGIYSYRLVRGSPINRDAGGARADWLAIHRAGQLDPRCAEFIPHAHGSQSSVWHGPDARVSTGWTHSPSDWTEFAIDDEGIARRLWWRAGQSNRCLVMFDGARWSEFGLPAAMDASSLVPPGVLLIDSIDQHARSRDLPDPVRAGRLVERSLAALSARLGLEFSVGQRIIAGQSYGGLAAASVVVHRPDLARTAICQSGSFWYRDGGDRSRMREPGELIERVLSLSGRHGVRLVMQAGTDEAHMLHQSQMMRDAATAAGMLVDLDAWRGGHDYAWWRHGLIHALRSIERYATDKMVADNGATDVSTTRGVTR